MNFIKNHIIDSFELSDNKLEKVLSLVRTKGYKANISQHQTYRGIPLQEGTRLKPMNPVFIIKIKLGK